MKRFVIQMGFCLVVFFLASLAFGAEKKVKPGPLAGTWECMSHGSSQGDMPFTLFLEQNKEDVSGSISSPIGGTQMSSGIFKKKRLEIQIVAPGVTYTITGQLKKGQLSGEWSNDGGEKGAWEGKKQPPASR
jgi:hypothetical protein